MDSTTAAEAIKELTLIMLHLTRFTERGRFADPSGGFYAWKGYDFGVLNELDDADYIRQGAHPFRSKSVYLTDAGMEQARELLMKYHITDWESGGEHE